MGTFEQFQESLREALTHLYDPTYQPPAILCAAVGCQAQDGIESVQAAILQAIERLKPTPNVPSSARSQRIYDVLSCRYVQQLTQDETAARLAITPRHLRREQHDAINLLASTLWKQHQHAAEKHIGEGAGPPVGADQAETETAEWRAQVRQELESLQKRAPGSVADLQETLTRVADLARSVACSRGVGLQLLPVESGLVAAIHPSGLRQTLLGGITDLLRHMSAGTIALGAAGFEERIRITMVASPATVDDVPDDYHLRELLALQGGTVRLMAEDSRLSLHIDIPRARAVQVLVVDDNADLVHFYRRYVLGTRYNIVGVAEGRRAIEMIEEMVPDVIVLDVMLPDIDGWELLAHLREHPTTRPIPVIVCSVVREAELSLALGATLYVPKPVRRAQFLEALDRAISQAAAEA